MTVAAVPLFDTQPEWPACVHCGHGDTRRWSENRDGQLRRCEKCRRLTRWRYR